MNGYSNYATWNVQLWLDNDEGLYSYYTELLASADEEDITGDWVRSVVEEVMPNGTPDFDTHGVSYSTVNWVELAEEGLTTKKEL